MRAMTILTYYTLVFLIVFCLFQICYGKRKIFSIKVQNGLGGKEFKKFEIDSQNLQELNIKEEDMDRVLATVNEDGQISSLSLDGREVPVANRQNIVRQALYWYNDIHNNTVFVSRDNFTNASMADMHKDSTLAPLQLGMIWESEFQVKTDGEIPTEVELHTGRDAAFIKLANKSIFLKTVSADVIIRGSIKFLDSELGLYVKVRSFISGRIIFEHHVAASQATGVQELLCYLSNLTDGHLVMLTTLGDMSMSLSKEEREGLERLGSSMAGSLRFEDLWSWVWISGGVTLLETVVHATSVAGRPMPVMPASIGSHLIRNLHATKSKICKQWKNDEAFDTRRLFCTFHEGYTELCNCENPYLYQEIPKNIHWKERIGVLIITCARPLYLYRLLLNLLSQPGVRKEDVLCCVDGVTSLETLRLLEVLNITAVVHAPEGKTLTARIFRHLRFTLYSALRTFNHSSVDKFIILEDDLVLAPDFYSYMQQTTVLLDADPSLYSISAYNAHAFPHTARNTSRLYRDDGFPSCGWLVKKSFIVEVLPLWPNSDINSDWDYWMGMGLVRGNRSVVVPEVPRVRHGGISAGAHVWGIEAVYMLQKPVTVDPDIVVDTDSVLLHNYEQELLSLLQRSRPFNLTHSLHSLMQGDDVIHLLYIVSEEEDGATAFRMLAHTLGIWCYDKRGSHGGMWRLPYYNNTLLIMALPTSNYKQFVQPGYSAVTGSAADLRRLIQTMRAREIFVYEHHEKDDYSVILFGRRPR